MVFLLIFLIIILMVITLKIKINFTDFEFNTQKHNKLEKDYKIKITVYTFNKIPIIKTKITNEKIQQIIKNPKIKEAIKNQETKLIENRKDIDINVIKSIKKIKIEIEEIQLKITIGTENAATTAFIIPILSTIIATVLSRNIKKYNDKQTFEIKPVYMNQNLLNIEFSGIIQIKMIHIINTICIVNKKKRKGDKNERTSNRRSYDYSYE